MQFFKSFAIIFSLALFGSITVVAQTTSIVVPIEDGDFMVVGANSEEAPAEDSPFLEDAVDKKIVWNKGWDTSIGNKIEIDPTVNIEFRRLEPVFGYPGIIFAGRDIVHWGEQRVFNTSQKIYAKAVLLVDKGDTLEGGPFEWSTNNQGFISFHNIVRRDRQRGWIGGWTDPRPGEKVWFFIMSDDEKYSSNPISFIWP